MMIPSKGNQTETDKHRTIPVTCGIEKRTQMTPSMRQKQKLNYKSWSPLVAQQVKDLALSLQWLESLLWHRLDP